MKWSVGRSVGRCTLSSYSYTSGPSLSSLSSQAPPSNTLCVPRIIPSPFRGASPGRVGLYQGPVL